VRDAPPVILIDETLAHQCWPHQNPLGQRMRLWGEFREVVGMVGQVHHYGLEKQPQPTIYAPYEQMPDKAMALAVRTTMETPDRGERREAGGVVGGSRPAGVSDPQHGRVYFAGRNRAARLDYTAGWFSRASRCCWRRSGFMASFPTASPQRTREFGTSHGAGLHAWATKGAGNSERSQDRA
jgi:hypothetical protein